MCLPQCLSFITETGVVSVFPTPSWVPVPFPCASLSGPGSRDGPLWGPDHHAKDEPEAEWGLRLESMWLDHETLCLWPTHVEVDLGRASHGGAGAASVLVVSAPPLEEDPGQTQTLQCIQVLGCTCVAPTVMFSVTPSPRLDRGEESADHRARLAADRVEKWLSLSNVQNVKRSKCESWNVSNKT